MEVLRPFGGKLHAFLSCLPNVGRRALTTRDMPLTPADKADREKQTLMLPADPSYKELAATAAESQVLRDVAETYGLIVPSCMARLSIMC